VADTICMPPHLMPMLTLLSSAIEGATSWLTGVRWRRGEAPLLHQAIRGRGSQQYGGHQTGAAGVQVGRAEA
jgi:hypothetical protein